MWMERFRRRYAATERSDVRVEGEKKRKEESNICSRPPAETTTGRLSIQNPTNQFCGRKRSRDSAVHYELWFEGKQRFSLSRFTFFRLMLNCSKWLNVSFACRRVDTCARVTYLLTPNKHTTEVNAEALRIGMAPLKLSISPHPPSPPL